MNPHVEVVWFAKPPREVGLASERKLPSPIPTVQTPPAPASVSVANQERERQRDQEQYERGLRDGEKALREQLLQQRNELITLQSGILTSLRASLPGLIQENEKALISLALDVAQRVVAATPVSAELVESLIREAVNQLEEHGDLTVLLNPSDLNLIEKINSPVLVTEIGGERIRFTASPGISPGGCLVKTRFGSVDSRRETRWNLVTESLGLS